MVESRLPSYCLYLIGLTHTDDRSLVGGYYYRPIARGADQWFSSHKSAWISLRKWDTSPPSYRSQRRQATRSQRWNMKSNRLVIAAVCLAFLVLILLFEDSEQSRDVWTHGGARNHKTKHSGQPGMKRHGRNRRRQHLRKITGRQSGHHRAVKTPRHGEWNGRCRWLNCFTETRQTSVGFRWKFDCADFQFLLLIPLYRFALFRFYAFVFVCFIYFFHFFILASLMHSRKNWRDGIPSNLLTAKSTIADGEKSDSAKKDKRTHHHFLVPFEKITLEKSPGIWHRFR